MNIAGGIIRSKEKYMYKYYRLQYYSFVCVDAVSILLCNLVKATHQSLSIDRNTLY